MLNDTVECENNTTECKNDIAECKMVSLFARGEPKRTRTPTWTTLLLG